MGLLTKVRNSVAVLLPCLLLLMYITGHHYLHTVPFALPAPAAVIQPSTSLRTDLNNAAGWIPSVPDDKVNGAISRSKDTQGAAKPKVKLIILTYKRSGSSFTGQLFDQHPDVFYVFEPLYALMHSRNRVTMQTDAKKFEDEADAVMEGYLNCSLQQTDRRVLTSPFQRLGLKTAAFQRCLRASHHDHNPQTEAVSKCLPGLRRACSQSAVVVLKTIRYTMAKAMTLMARDPEVKVIHLLRDPRGTLYSRMSRAEKHIITQRTVEDYSRSYCLRIRTDLTTGDRVEGSYPDRLLRVRYEDLALAPVRLARKLLAFAGLNLSAQQEGHIREITSQPTYKMTFHSVAPLKTNSTAAAFAWRRAFNVSYTSLIDVSCKDVYSRAGYLPVASGEQLRDAGVPSMLASGTVPGFLR